MQRNIIFTKYLLAAFNKKNTKNKWLQNITGNPRWSNVFHKLDSPSQKIEAVLATVTIRRVVIPLHKYNSYVIIIVSILINLTRFIDMFYLSKLTCVISRKVKTKDQATCSS